MIYAANCRASKAFRTALSSLLLLLMIARIISSWSKLNASAIVWMTSTRMPQIFSVTVSSTDDCVTSRNTPPMVSYDSYRLTYPRILYCSMQSEMDAIWDAKSRHWHLPRFRSLLASANETSIAQRIEYILYAS